MIRSAAVEANNRNKELYQTEVLALQERHAINGLYNKKKE